MVPDEEYEEDSLLDLSGAKPEKDETGDASNLEELTRWIDDFILHHMRDDFLVVEMQGRYVQFVYDDDTEEIYCEAVSNDFLPPERQVSEDRIGLLIALGFNEPGGNPDGSPNYWRTWDKHDYFSAKHVASTILQIFQDVYRCDMNGGLHMERGF